MKEVVRLGDPTNHGGSVISASSQITVNGIPVALEGDLVSCPIKYHGTTPIIQGDEKMQFGGRAVAVNGSLCGCGCKLISTNSNAGST